MKPLAIDLYCGLEALDERRKEASRKAASAQIAKIPFELARWIAHVYHP